MKIYTKTGDKGQTSIIGGEKRSKASDRVEAYGTIDELNSLVGYIISQMQTYREIKKELEEIQHTLFDCGTDMATPNSTKGYRTTAESVEWLEQKIDKYADVPPELQEFILPGGCGIASLLHMARTVARRAERCVVRVRDSEEINLEALIFLNRLSDYFYAIARFINFREGREDISYRRNGKVFYN
ncbi:cob(I)yrinic acid a,c-diamide adenosyltransferase [Enterococcus rivorum]|uniref:Corrinoid adenosyltransferase n=1 Tax=Enterococcus rivorum TaxID=762845 RepID=A0A1E5KU41_9ENTE|nr:cob(I)yrinic acid a,c-diamide adenosyltransferase [Enterococcus rivorum]MBP2100632.1 cob(I)alamin adenosyltransferase [Enterococcus rivorum]OEH81383.1 ATP:cob(I)alamin adenosyltransferase [Enterococcus rivorum]